MCFAAFLDLSLKIFTYASNNGKRRLTRNLPPYRAVDRGGFVTRITCIWDGVLVPAIRDFFSDPSPTSKLGSIHPAWSRSPSFDTSVPVISSKNKAILSASLPLGKGGFVCLRHSAAFYAPLGGFDSQYSRSPVEWKPWFCLFIYVDARLLLFGKADAGPNGSLDEVKKRRPGTSY